MIVKVQLALMTLGVILVASSEVYAVEGKVSISAPWVAEGKVYHTASNSMKFLGEFSGTMYVDHGEGYMNTATFTCPAVEKIDKESLKFSVEGDCFITTYNGDLIFAKMSCEGENGVCTGLFELDGGTGDFVGITGQGEMMTRTVFESMITDLGQGTVINSAAGLANWPEISYTIPDNSDE